METVSLKLDDAFARDLERLMRKHRYTTKTEFIREAMRDKMRDLEVKERLHVLERLYGFSKKRTTEEEFRRIRQELSRELESEFDDMNRSGVATDATSRKRSKS